MAISDNVKRGTVELLVLTLLKEGDKYGYELIQELSARSHNRYSLVETSLYPCLYRLIDKKIITDRQEKVGKRRVRVYYHLEEEGVAYLEAIRKEYLSLTRGALDILNIKSLEEMTDEE